MFDAASFIVFEEITMLKFLTCQSIIITKKNKVCFIYILFCKTQVFVVHKL